MIEATGFSPELVDEIGKGPGVKFFSRGYDCYVFDYDKALDYYNSHRYELNRKARQGNDPEPEKNYLNVSDLAYILGVAPVEAARIGEAAGAKDFNPVLKCDIYDLKACRAYLKAKKNKPSLYAGAPPVPPVKKQR